MREDAIGIEEGRVGVFSSQDEYDMMHERHRIFPEIFEDRNHQKIIDVAAGVGIVGKRVQTRYSAEIICNDIAPSCQRIMQQSGLKTASFDIDNANEPFPFEDHTFDALISLATIEHVIETDHFVEEMKRVLTPDGCLYLSAPNYSGVLYLVPFLLTGRTFHNPLDKKDKYEFFAHVRYFTYRTLIEYVESFGFYADTVYVPKPATGTKYLALKKKSPMAARLFKFGMMTIYKLMGPRWCSEPVICFRQGEASRKKPKVKIM